MPGGPSEEKGGNKGDRMGGAGGGTPPEPKPDKSGGDGGGTPPEPKPDKQR